MEKINSPEDNSVNEKEKSEKENIPHPQVKNDNDKTEKSRIEYLKTEEAIKEASQISDKNLRVEMYLDIAKTGQEKVLDILEKEISGYNIDTLDDLGRDDIIFAYGNKLKLKENLEKYVQILIDYGRYDDADQLIEKLNHDVFEWDTGSGQEDSALNLSPDVDLYLYMAEHNNDDKAWNKALECATKKENHRSQNEKSWDIFYRDEALIDIASTAAKLKKDEIVEKAVTLFTSDYVPSNINAYYDDFILKSRHYSLYYNLAKNGYEKAWQWLFAKAKDDREFNRFNLGDKHLYFEGIVRLATETNRSDILDLVSKELSPEELDRAKKNYNYGVRI